METRFLPNLQQPRTSTEKQKVASIPGATFWFSVDVRGCWRFGRNRASVSGFLLKMHRLSSNKDSSYYLLEAFVAQLVELLTQKIHFFTNAGSSLL